MKRSLFLFLSFLLVIFTACSENGSNTEAEEPKVYNLGEDAIVGSEQVRLMDIGYSSYYVMSYGLPVNAPQGMLFLVTNWAVGNAGKNEITVSTEDFNCYIDNVQMQESIYTNTVTNAFPTFDTLNSDRIVSGLILFEVPENWETVELEFKPSSFDDENAIYKVSKSQVRDLSVPE